MTINETNLQFTGTPATRNQTTAIVLHHADAVTCSVEDIHHWHLGNKWIGIGYHFLVRKDGSVWRGRPIGWVGAHAKGANEFSVGICFEGSYESKETSMPVEQVQAGRELVAYLMLQYPEAAVKRHSDYCATDCPGRYFAFDQITGAVAQPAPAPAPEPELPAHSLLTRGSKGDEVRDMQSRLIALGYGCGQYGADGAFGAATEAAVKAFQAANHLSADGKCGVKTWAALDGEPVSAPACPYAEPAANVKRGSKGDGVRWVQWQLRRLGYDIGGTGIDGDCGSKTAAAITAFQRDRGLSADGIAGAKTRAALGGL